MHLVYDFKDAVVVYIPPRLSSGTDQAVSKPSQEPLRCFPQWTIPVGSTPPTALSSPIFLKPPSAAVNARRF